MTIYKISAANAQGEKSRAIKRSGYLTAISALVGILLGGRFIFYEKNPQVLFIWISIFAILLTFILWQSLRRTSKFLSEAYSSFEITADENTLTKKQKDTPDVQLARAEVKRIEEHQGKGFRICTNDWQRTIWVPCELDGYEQLKADILALPGVEITSKSQAWLRSYLIIAAMLLLFAVSVLADNKWLAVGASLVLASYFLFVPIKQYRNPNLTTRGRRLLLWLAFIGVCMLARAVILWRS